MSSSSNEPAAPSWTIWTRTHSFFTSARPAIAGPRRTMSEQRRHCCYDGSRKEGLDEREHFVRPPCHTDVGGSSEHPELRIGQELERLDAPWRPRRRRRRRDARRCRRADEPLGVERDHVLVEAGQSPLVLGHDRRFERARPVSRHIDPHVADVGPDRLRRHAVARVPGPVALRGREPRSRGGRSARPTTRPRSPAWPARPAARSGQRDRDPRFGPARPDAQPAPDRSPVAATPSRPSVPAPPSPPAARFVSCVIS